MLNAFVPAVLIEVVAENYRYLMHESAFSTGDALIVDPPLRANERVLSGLFATAISRVSPRSRPEARVDRVYGDDDDEEAVEENNGKLSVGRVDYLAWLGDQTIAVELKVVQSNFDTARITDRLMQRWRSVNDQAKTALHALQKNNQKYPNSAAIAVLVVIGRRTLSSIDRAKVRHEHRDEFEKNVNTFSAELSGALTPDFHSNYVNPAEFRFARRKKRGVDHDGILYVPIVSFFVNRYL